MARPPSQEPTAAELEILRTLWDSGPAELAEVCARLRQRRPVATTTVATMLGILKEKGLVKRSSGPRGYLWEARVSKKATASGMLRRFIERVFEGSAQRLVAHLVSEGSLSQREREEIVSLLSVAREKKGPKR